MKKALNFTCDWRFQFLFLGIWWYGNYLFTLKLVFVQKIFLLIFFPQFSQYLSFDELATFAMSFFINEFNIWLFYIVKQRWISQIFINVMQFMDIELFPWIYFYLLTTVFIDFQIYFAVKYGFSSISKSSRSLSYAAILWFQLCFLAINLIFFLHIFSLNRSKRDSSCFHVYIMLNEKLEFSANQRSLHRPISTNESCKRLKRRIFKMMWDNFLNGPPATTLSLRWIEIGMSYLYLFLLSLWLDT